MKKKQHLLPIQYCSTKRYLETNYCFLCVKSKTLSCCHLWVLL